MRFRSCLIAHLHLSLAGSQQGAPLSRSSRSADGDVRRHGGRKQDHRRRRGLRRRVRRAQGVVGRDLEPADLCVDPLRAECEYFVHYVLTGTPPISDGAAGLHVVGARGASALARRQPARGFASVKLMLRAVWRWVQAARRNRIDNEHQRLLLAFSLAADANCVDIGAHRGAVLRDMVRCAPEGSHIAFEPLPDKAAELRSAFPEVDVREAAVCDENGTASFVHVVSNPELRASGSVSTRARRRSSASPFRRSALTTCYRRATSRISSRSTWRARSFSCCVEPA